MPKGRIKRAFLTEIDCPARKKEQDEENIPAGRQGAGVTQLHYHAGRICHADVSQIVTRRNFSGVEAARRAPRAGKFC